MTCTRCGSSEIPAKMFVSLGFTRCRKCAGALCQELLGYIRDFEARWPKVKKPKNPDLPIGGPLHGYCCRNSACQVKLPDWKPGESAYCGLCVQEGKAS